MVTEKSKFPWTGVAIFASIIFGAAVGRQFGASETSHATSDTFATIAQRPSTTPASPPEVIKKMMQDHGKVITNFSVEGLPLTGWAVQPNAQIARAEIIYTTADGRYALVGRMLEINSAGALVNQNLRLAQEHGPKIDLDHIWASLNEVSYIKQGASDDQAKVVLYGFMDPNCGYCHQAFTLLEPYTAAGLQIRWIPVGVIDPRSSKEKAAALLQAQDPASKMTSAYESWAQDHGAGFEMATTIDPPTQAKLDKNLQVMGVLGSRSTPSFIYKDADGKVKKFTGVIPNNQIASMFHLPPINQAHATVGPISGQ